MEIRLHCRGGQGAATAATILARAAAEEGKYVQAFPFFGTERRGAPVMAFVRISDTPIWVRCQIYNPNYVLVLDPTLLEVVNVIAGLRKEGIIIINTSQSPEDIQLGVKNVATVDATAIALNVLGVPIPNTVMCGAFVAASKIVGFESIATAIRDILPKEFAEKNVEAALLGYKKVRVKTYEKSKSGI